MIVKLVVGDLVVGMYLHDLGASWIKNPFWRNSFLITASKEIDSLKASGIAEVWIDTDKGLDLPQSNTESASALASTPHATADLTAAPQEYPPAGQIAPASMAEELQRATRICADSKVAVASMFQEARMGNTVDAAGVTRLVQDISDSVSRNANALISLARLKTADDYTYMHSVAVCAMMIALARQLGQGQEQVRAAGVAGLLHDMGKAMLPMAVLNKPGKLTPGEFAIVKSHPELGHKILQRGGTADAMALDVCLHHHEKIDGTGYPENLRAEQISLHARMAAVCDVYDAVTSNRPYKTGWDPAESMRKMGGWVGTHFDNVVFHAFAKSLGIYPVGSLLLLTSGLIGVVTAPGSRSLTLPVVKVFYGTKPGQRVTPYSVDLAEPGCREKIVSRQDPAKWRFADLNELWMAE